MALEHFNLIKQICQSGLTHAGTPEFYEHVVKLQDLLVLQGQASAKASSRNAARKQAKALSTLLERHRPGYRTVVESDATRIATRLRPDTVTVLRQRGSLDQNHQFAAEEIHEIYGALTDGLTAKSRPPNEMRAKLRTLGSWHQPFERMSDRLVRLYHDHYRPWSIEASKRKLGSSTLLELTLNVLICGQSLHEIERGQNLRNGAASKHFREALQQYVEIAGWEKSSSGNDSRLRSHLKS